MARIRRDAPEVRVSGVLYERRPPKTLKQRIENWRKKMKRFAYWHYVAHRIGATVDRKVFDLLDAVIRFIHAAPKWPNGKTGYGLDDLGEGCKQIGAELFITRDIHSDEALDFVRRMNADLDWFSARAFSSQCFTRFRSKDRSTSTSARCRTTEEVVRSGFGSCSTARKKSESRFTASRRKLTSASVLHYPIRDYPHRTA